jgi:hypothetical protein
MWHAIYDIATGELRSTGTVLADPLPEGLASMPCGDMRPTGEWNASTHMFDAPAAEPTVMSPQDFMGMFTFDEEKAIRALAQTDMVMTTFLARVQRARTVTLSHPDTVNGIGYCVAVGAITQDRASEILNG